MYICDMKINTLEDLLILLGSDQPFDFSNSDNSFSDCLTESGNIAYNKLRDILHFMEKEHIISDFDEDKLDKYINFNY